MYVSYDAVAKAAEEHAVFERLPVFVLLERATDPEIREIVDPPAPAGSGYRSLADYEAAPVT
ncbi:hypothetical protein ACU639_31225 [Streptomyces cynarae]|uniref:hypothetical protein n=1 Tax=Streptomyces cynarae TaxID=2981134 RepID=UPI00406C7DFB